MSITKKSILSVFKPKPEQKEQRVKGLSSTVTTVLSIFLLSVALVPLILDSNFTKLERYDITIFSNLLFFPTCFALTIAAFPLPVIQRCIRVCLKKSDQADRTTQDFIKALSDTCTTVGVQFTGIQLALNLGALYIGSDAITTLWQAMVPLCLGLGIKILFLDPIENRLAGLPTSESEEAPSPFHSSWIGISGLPFLAILYSYASGAPDFGILFNAPAFLIVFGCVISLNLLNAPPKYDIPLRKIIKIDRNDKLSSRKAAVKMEILANAALRGGVLGSLLACFLLATKISETEAFNHEILMASHSILYSSIAYAILMSLSTRYRLQAGSIKLRAELPPNFTLKIIPIILVTFMVLMAYS